MFSQEENKILDGIFFEEFLSMCSFNFLELIVIKMILDGYKMREIFVKFDLKERNFYKKFLKLKEKIKNNIEVV